MTADTEPITTAPGGGECLVSDSNKDMYQKAPMTSLPANNEKQNKDLKQNENENNQNSNRLDDGEIVYPGWFTKVAVGISLALAIFLVHFPSVYLLKILM